MSQVKDCLLYETPPATPPHMIQFRKKHERKPGMRIVHRGLRDQILPPANHTYGIVGEAGASSVTDHIRDLWENPHKTEISQYISNQNEIYYSRNKKEPLGKSMKSSTDVPPELLNDPKFSFGLQSAANDVTVKQLLEIDNKMKTPQLFSRMSLEQQQKEEKEVLQKRDLHYEWDKLKIDPTNYCFGSPPRNAKKIPTKFLKYSSDGVKQALKENICDTNNKVEKRFKPMPDEFVYGLPKVVDASLGAKECIHGTDDELKNFVEYKEAIKGRNRTVPYVHNLVSQPNFHKDGVSAQTLLNPSKCSSLGISEIDLCQLMPLNQAMSILKNSKIFTDDTQEKQILQIVEQKFQEKCSIKDIIDIVKSFAINTC